MNMMRTRTFSGTTNAEMSERERTNRVLARRAAAEGIVLLRNEDDLLPIAKGSRIALYGSGASRTIKGGTGSGDVNERQSVNVYQGLVDAGYEVTTKDWIDAFDAQYQQARYDWRDDILERTKDVDPVMGFFDVYSSTPFVVPAGGDITKTDTDLAIYVLSRVAGEGADRYDRKGDYYLTDTEAVQIQAVCENYTHVVLVINAGGPIDLSFTDDYKNMEAIVFLSQAGMEGGSALADVLSGDVTPSGRLTDTWAFRYQDYPSAATFSHNNGNVQEEIYGEGIYVGYRYFDTYQVPVRYGFGYGLSYTTFETVMQSASLRDDKTVVLEAAVKNTGVLYSGKEVVQVYATCPAGQLDKEYRRLVAFAKTDLLAPGAAQVLTIEVPVDQLTSYSEETPGWILEAGSYILWAGSSLATAAPAAVLTLDETAVVTKTTNICKPQQPVEELHSDAEQTTARREALLTEIQECGLPQMALHAADIETCVVNYRPNSELVTGEASAFVDTLTLDQLVALSSGDPGKGQGSNLGSAGISVPGSAGETNGCAKEQNLASIVLADGPAGLRLMKEYEVKDGTIINKPFQASLEGGLFCEVQPDPEAETYYQYCTAIPVGTLLAQTWDLPLVEEVGVMIGGEMEAFGVTLWLAPGMNVHRNPLCGRNFEYYSEDPLLSGRMAGAMTRGVQTVPGCGTTIKHYAANNQEDNRMGSNSILTERTLREIYLKGFEVAITEAQPMSIMTSYNLINGVHAANSNDLCTKAARCEWGFQGVMMTDWTTTMQMDDPQRSTADGCMRAGNDIVMPGAVTDHEDIRRALEDGSLSLEDLKACISRLVNIVWQSNQYEGAVAYRKA